jgi:hypothetical protein
MINKSLSAPKGAGGDFFVIVENWNLVSFPSNAIFARLNKFLYGTTAF